MLKEKMHKGMKATEKIVNLSIIVPLYNAEKYLHQCLDSICGQVRPDIEILLLNDGSIDRSAEICREYSRRDDRIRYYEHYNMGQGATELKGVYLASGKYFTFVDADDWIAPEFAEKMIDKSEKEDADVCECCWYKYDERVEKVTSVGANEKQNDIFKFRLSHLWGRIYKRSFFIENDIQIPSCLHQDLATYPVIALSAGKICYVDLPLYFYRVNTGISVTDKTHADFDVDKVFDFLFAELNKRKLYHAYSNEWMELAIYMLSVKGRQWKRIAKEVYEKNQEKACQFIEGYFPEWRNAYSISYRIWGSYNSSRIANELMPEYDLLSEEQCFYWKSSIISLMSQPLQMDYTCTDHIGQKMVQRDFDKEFLKLEFDTDEYLLIDFLEERYDVYKIAEGSYVTLSDGVDKESLPDGTVLQRISAECTKLWKECCCRFAEHLKNKMDCSHIILLEFYLNEKSVGFDGECDYFEVRDMNQVLKDYYDYFIQLIPNAVRIKVPDELCYTDRYFEYGNHPFYYNKRMFYEIAKCIRNLVNR